MHRRCDQGRRQVGLRCRGRCTGEMHGEMHGGEDAGEDAGGDVGRGDAGADAGRTCWCSTRLLYASSALMATRTSSPARTGISPPGSGAAGLAASPAGAGSAAAASAEMVSRFASAAPKVSVVVNPYRSSASEAAASSLFRMAVAGSSVNWTVSAIVESTGNAARPRMARKASRAPPAVRHAPVIFTGMSPSKSSATLPNRSRTSSGSGYGRPTGCAAAGTSPKMHCTPGSDLNGHEARSNQWQPVAISGHQWPSVAPT